MKLTIFIDGASRGNPGRSAIGIALYDPEGQLLKEVGLEIGVTTNNVAEYTALLYGLGEALLYVHKLPNKINGLELTIYSDSELLINQMTGRYQVKNEDIKRLHLLAQRLISGLEKVSFEKLSHDENKTADRLANKVLDKKQ
ncbi:MAG: ribonuclease HI family protein [Candidatus Omnitrophota bacterium]